MITSPIFTVIDLYKSKIMRHRISPLLFGTPEMSKIDDMEFGYSLFGPPYEKEAHKVFCQKNNLDPSEVFYVQQGRSCVVSKKKLITTNLSVCSALAIRVGDINILAHIDAGKWTCKIVGPIRDFFQKDSLAGLKKDIQCKLFLGNIPAIHPDTLHALDAIGILSVFINLTEIQEDIAQYLKKRLVYHANLGVRHGFNLFKLYTKSENSEYHDIQKFLKLTGISTSEEITPCTLMLNTLLEEPNFSLKKQGLINFVQPGTIVSSEDLNSINKPTCFF